MARPRLKLWFDREGEYLEVTFEDREGSFHQSPSDHVMKKVDQSGQIIGFGVLGVITLHPIP